LRPTKYTRILIIVNTGVFGREAAMERSDSAMRARNMEPASAANRAIWRIRLRWLAAIGFALIPVVFTAAASAVAQITHQSEAGAALTVAIGAGVSALVGLLVMRMSSPALTQYGFRAPRRAAAVWWFVPLPVTIGIVLVSAGVHVGWQTALAYLVLTVAVAFDEEIWFRGIVLAVLRSGGTRVAIVGSSVMFGVLHLANLAGGEDPSSAILQLLFAVVFGVVAAELVVITASLWPVIVWHALWDFTNYVGGNATTGATLAGVGIACAVMIAYAIVLWRRTAPTPA